MHIADRRLCTLLLGLVFPLAGCQSLALPLLPWLKEPTRDVPAEYPYLAGKAVTIAVWADNDVMFEFPNVQYELAEHLAVELEARVEDLAVVPNRDVVDLIARTSDWDRRHPSWIASQFNADRVLLVELIEYSTREPGSTHLLRGTIHANVKIYDPAYPDAAASYRTTIEVREPKDEVAAYGLSENDIRRAAMERFAAEAAGRFYDRKVKIE